MLLHIQDGCALIVGYILGGLQESEITMLRRMLARLNQTMGPLRKWLKILSMDRGNWGTDLFCELKQDYGIDFVSRVRDDYVTSLRPGRHGVKVRGFYRGRWGIENRVFARCRRPGTSTGRQGTDVARCWRGWHRRSREPSPDRGGPCSLKIERQKCATRLAPLFLR